MKRRLSIRDVRALVAKIPDPSGIVLIGGQALNYWAEALDIATEDSHGEFGPALSDDIDFLGSAKAAMSFGKAAGGHVKVAVIDDAASPNTALVTLDIDGEKHLVDFLADLMGFARVEIEDVKARAVPVGMVSGGLQPILVMHPIHCLQSQLENIYGQLDRRTEPGGDRYVGRIRLAIEACRRIIERYLAAGDVRSALKISEKAHSLSLLPAALRARLEDEVRIDDAIPDSDAFPSAFREKRRPQMKARLEAKLAKAKRIRASGRKRSLTKSKLSTR